MKFRLSTLLLVIALFATGAGWLIDNVRRNSEQQRILDGARFFTNPAVVESVASAYYDNPSKFDAALEDLLIMEIRRLAVNQDWIIAYRDEIYPADVADSSQSAIILARRLLRLLDYSTAEQYMERFREIYTKEQCPEYYNNESPESLQLRSLLENALSAPNDLIAG